MTRSVALILCSLCLTLATSDRLEARTWTSAGGQYTIEAEFVELKDGNVKLRKADGTLLSVELSKLIAADQRYVEQLQAPTDTSPDGLDSLLVAARQLLRDGRLAEANVKIEQAVAKATGADEKQQVADLRDLSGQLTQFWSAVAEAGSRLPGGAELEIGRATVSVVEASDNRLVLRALGKNCRFTLDQPETIPSSLALVLAKQRLAGSESSKPIAAYESLGPEANNQRLWELAAGSPLVTTPLADITNTPLSGGQPATPTTPNNSAIPQPVPPSTTDPQSNAPRKREPIPDESVIAKKRKEIRTLFADDFKSVDPKNKYELAKKLFTLAQETLVDDPAAAFVLYLEAADLAADVGDANSAMQVLDQVSASFDDPAMPSREAKVLATAIKVTNPPLTAQTVVLIGDRATQLIDKAIAAEDFSAAESAVDTAIGVARRMKDRQAQVLLGKREKEIADQRKAFGAIIAARQALAKNPNDAEANRTLAIYYCAKRNDWDEGLPLLAKLDNQQVAQAAQRDLETPTDHDDCYDLAETWWTLGEEDPSGLGPALTRRAAHWYEQALPGLSALEKVKAEKRIEEADQLAAADTATDAKPVLLTSLPLVGNQGIELTRGVLHLAVTINGKTFTNGIWALPQAGAAGQIGYTLNREYSTLTGVVGMDDSMPGANAYSSVVFSIYNEKRKLLWNSAPLKQRGTGQAFKIKVQGVETLYLVTQLSGNSNTYCYAVWGDPTLEK